MLLQSVWEESKAQFRDDHNDKEPKGLQSLILNKNHKFGDNGVKQLMLVLKEDFWLKSLSLRRCGITKQGGESILELLQTNSVLTKMQLQENDIPEEITHVVSKILRRRHKKGGRISLKSQLINWKTMSAQDTKKYQKHCSARILRSNKCSINEMERYKANTVKDDCWKKMLKFKRKPLNQNRADIRRIKAKNHVEIIHLHKLESDLLDVANRNSKLTEKLINNRRLFEAENVQRRNAEKECQKLELQLINVKKKVSKFNTLHSNTQEESYLMENVQNVFRKLEAISASKKLDIREDSDLKEKQEIKQLPYKRIDYPLQRRDPTTLHRKHRNLSIRHNYLHRGNIHDREFSQKFNTHFPNIKVR